MKTHDEVMQEIAGLKEMVESAIAQDCFGDYIGFMDDEHHTYFFESGDAKGVDERNSEMLRKGFKIAVKKKMSSLWAMARDTYEKELATM